MRFYTGNMFPKKYKNAIFLARHGSWNRTKKFGGDVIAIFLNKDGTVKSSEPFITGFLDDNNYIGRPVDVEFMADGSMLLSDDWNGAIYRITYGKAHDRQPLSEICGRGACALGRFLFMLTNHADRFVHADRCRGAPCLCRQSSRCAARRSPSAPPLALPATAKRASRKRRKCPRSAASRRPIC